MKNIILLLLMALMSQSINAQGSNSEPKLIVRPFIENGIDFIRSDRLIENYETQSKYFWGLGLQVGHPETAIVIPYAQFSLSNFEVEKTTSENTTDDFVLETTQITGGLVVPFKKTNNLYYKTKVGYSYSMINESFYDIDTNSHGIQIGFGVERKLIGYSRIFIDLSYNYQKTGKSEFRDFDMIKLSAGFIL